MEHSPTNQGMDQTSHISAADWEQFFFLCLEFLAIARERRAAGVSPGAVAARCQSESIHATDPDTGAAPDIG